ncbi:hypothetical protein PV05_02041 [Exophiala xenobiotica]|uniref:Uncharacterized protein n=1 Tax=Exophiala xenobiotica TaxID=348802 RepID=A0A0D2F4W6_9EURO|nr:uncharacterized protein PV05_02041 [Exophiala xenobiotica]KIW61985.1 hypothetical protein PV05_02041 [Exophiala xenobiotica]
MSYNDDYAPRPRRDRPRFDQDAGPRYPDDDNDYADTRKSSAHRPRHEAAPPSYGSEEPRRRKDVDPRDVEPRDADKKKYRDYPSERDGDMKPTKSNTAAPRRRSPNEDDDQDSGSRRYHGGDAGAYGRSRGYREPIPHGDPDAMDRDVHKGKSTRPRRDDHDDFEPAPPRRAQTHREPDRRRRDDPYDEPPRRRYRSPEDRHSDPDRASARRRRDDERYDDRRYRGASGGHSRRDEGYASDKGYRRANRDSGRDRSYHDRERDRDRDRDRDRRYHDSRDRSRDRDGRSKKKGFSIDDIGGLVEQGQKHYKTVAPLVTSLAKMYLDNKK